MRSAREGSVIDADDAAGLGTATGRLAEDVELRRRMLLAAKDRGRSYIWKLTTSQRRRQILNVLGSARHGSTVTSMEVKRPSAIAT